MDLVVDVGNTETVIGLLPHEGLEVRARWRYATPVPRTADELLLLFRGFLGAGGVPPAEIQRIVLGSVVPVHGELLRRTFEGLKAGRIVVLDGAEGLPIRLDVEEPRTVGADRIANTLAAHHLFHEDTVVVDLGTATTFDCIDRSGAFIGGVIAPGIQAGREWLGGRTAKLPSVEIAPPERVIGRRTESCLQSGLFYAAVDGMDAIVRRILGEWERPQARVVATGGHAALLAPYMTTVHGVDPDLTLVGLALAGRVLAP